MPANKEQQQAIDGVTRFAMRPADDGPWAAFLKGSAGTGKTFTVARIISHLQERGAPDIALIAPTHKARKAALAALAGQGIDEGDLAYCGTVAAAIGKIPDMGEFLDDGSQKWMITGSLPEGLDTCTVVLVDEVSMVDEKELKLFREVFRGRAKVLFIGDFAQLRPVKGSSIADLAKRSKTAWELTEIMRTKGAGEGINQVANGLREKAELPDFAKSASVKVITSARDWKDLFLETENGVAIAYRNVKVDALNQAKHEYLHGSKALQAFLPGETMIVKDHPLPVDMDDPRHKLFNVADEAKIIRAAKARRVDFGYGVSVNLPEVTLENADGMSRQFFAVEASAGDKDYWPLLGRQREACLAMKKAWCKTRISSQEFRALPDVARQFTQAHAISSTSRSWFCRDHKALVRQAWAELYYGLQNKIALLSHPYAFTAHSAQGSTFDHVFVHWEDLERIRDPEDKRAAKYVAVSRAAKRVWIYKRSY